MIHLKFFNSQKFFSVCPFGSRLKNMFHNWLPEIKLNPDLFLNISFLAIINKMNNSLEFTNKCESINEGMYTYLYFLNSSSWLSEHVGTNSANCLIFNCWFKLHIEQNPLSGGVSTREFGFSALGFTRLMVLRLSQYCAGISLLKSPS